MRVIGGDYTKELVFGLSLEEYGEFQKKWEKDIVRDRMAKMRRVSSEQRTQPERGTE